VDRLRRCCAERPAGLSGPGCRGETIQPLVHFLDCLARPAMPICVGEDGVGAMTVTNGLYTIHIEMTDGGHGRAHGVIVLHDGKIAGGDSYFYYTGSYTGDRGKWRGELVTNEHTKSAGARPLFGGREVTCGFSGSYSADGAQVQGTALVGKTSVLFHARLKLCAEF
jgi:T3SS negative regulator,GrlR